MGKRAKKGKKQKRVALIEAMEGRVLLSATGAISGTVFLDPSQTGTLSGNVGIPNRQVYVDISGDGVYEFGDPTAITAADGTYTITGVAAGTYTLREILPTTFAQTAPASFAPSVTITTGQTLTEQDFGELQLTGTLGAAYNSSILPSDETVTDQIPQPDGKILVVGYGTSTGNGFIARYFADGTPDTLFGTGGLVDTGFEGIALDGVAVLPDGDITVIGNFSGPIIGGTAETNTAPVTELNADGSTKLQYAWNAEGLGTGYVANSVTIIPNGNVVVSGFVSEDSAPTAQENDDYSVFATQLNPNTGLPVTGFGNSGTASFDADAIYLTPTTADINTTILPDTLGGFYLVVASQGVASEDTTEVDRFDNNNLSVFDEYAAISYESAYNAPIVDVQVGGEILLSTVTEMESGDAQLEVDRFAPDGTFDTTFTDDLGIAFGSTTSVAQNSGLNTLPDGTTLALVETSSPNDDDTEQVRQGLCLQFNATGQPTDGTFTTNVLPLGTTDTRINNGSGGFLVRIEEFNAVPPGSNLGGGSGTTSSSPTNDAIVDPPLFTSVSGLFAATQSASALVTTTTTAETGEAVPAFVDGSVGFENTYIPQPAVIYNDAVQDLDVETTAPTATWETPLPATITVDQSPLPEQLQVEFTDSIAVDLRTLGSGNLQVTEPSGSVVTATYLGLQRSAVDGTSSGNNQALLADYSVPAPVGGWTTANNGTYKVELVGGQVSNDAVAIADEPNLGSFAVNVSTAPVVPPPSPTNQITGTVIGSGGSYADQGNIGANAFDGFLSTYYDANTATGAWTGLDLGVPKVVNQISFAPRSGFASRMTGGVFQASSTADFSSNVATLYTVTGIPVEGSLTTVSVSDTTAYRYVRYLGPAMGSCNIAEAQFFGPVATSTVTVSNLVSTVQSGIIVLLTATVSGSAGTPTGTLTFSDGSTVLGVSTMSGGSAIFSTAALPAGTDAITAVYSGDGAYAAGASSAVTVIVTAPLAGAPLLTPALPTVVLPPALVAGAKHKITVPVLITNTGGQIASGMIRVILYASLDGTLDDSDAVIATLQPSEKLKPGKNTKVTFHLTMLPASLGDGTFHLLAQVIDASGFAQTIATAATITVAAPFITPVLSLAKITVPAFLISGTKAYGSVVLSLTNNGNVAIGGMATIELLLTDTGSAAGTVIKTVLVKVTLAPGKTKNISIAPGLLPLLTAGIYQFAAIVDTPAANGAAAATVSVVDAASLQVSASIA